jgi:hypothetical protein
MRSQREMAIFSLFLLELLLSSATLPLLYAGKPDEPPLPPPGPIDPPPTPPPDGDDDDNDDDSDGGGGSSLPPIVIIVNQGQYSVNLDNPVANDGAQSVAINSILNGVGQSPSIIISSPQALEAAQHEQDLIDSGEVDPSTHPVFDPLGGNQPTHFVEINTHVSGDLSNPNTAGSAVAIVKAQITDNQGNVIFQTSITATSSQGLTLNDLAAQAAAELNKFLQNVVDQK